MYIINVLVSHSSFAQNLGLFILRVGIGIIFIFHGYPKIVGDIKQWHWLGSHMQNLGISFAPVFWGFLAACAEFFGGIALIAGFFTRLASAILIFQMIVALFYHFNKGDNFMVYSHPLSMLVVFVALMIAGSGPYSLDALLR